MDYFSKHYSVDYICDCASKEKIFSWHAMLCNLVEDSFKK